MGKTEEGAAQFEDAVARLPKYFLAVSGLAEARAAQGRFDEALKLYGKTIALCPDPNFHMAAGDIHTKLGQADKQFETITAAIVYAGLTWAALAQGTKDPRTGSGTHDHPVRPHVDWRDGDQ